MKRYIKLAILITAVIFLAACGAGRKFERPQPETLTLGQTTPKEILQRFGKPSFKHSTNSGGKERLHYFGYSYVNSILGQAAFKAVIPARSSAFYFLDDILVGYYFTSSFRNDSTYFEPKKVKQIKKGITTRVQVINLLGTSYGEFLFPQFFPNMKKLEKDLKNKEGKGIWYIYDQTKSRGRSDFFSYNIVDPMSRPIFSFF